MAFRRFISKPLTAAFKPVYTPQFRLMSSVQSTFDTVVASKGPAIAQISDNSVKLKFYALYKQATVGDVSGSESKLCCSRPIADLNPRPPRNVGSQGQG